MMRKIRKPLFWLILAAPGLAMTISLILGKALAMDLLHPSGEFSVRLMIAAMLAGPLAGIFGPNRFFRGWLAIRRNLGVAAFGYAMLHMVFYIIDSGTMAAMIDEFTMAPIWTGWLALILMAIPAIISFDRAIRAMGKNRWKAFQRLVYPCLIGSLAHWLLLDWDWAPPVVHLAPVLIAWLVLIAMHQRNRRSGRNFAR